MTSPAWYIIPSKYPLSRWINLLHWPYTLWHLSYVVIGASLASTITWNVLGWTVLAFFLGMGVAAHCFDLLKGDPLKLNISPAALWLTGTIALLAAAGLGSRAVIQGDVSVWLILAVAIGVTLSLGYNLEWAGLHGDWQFATWWAVFPLLTGYFAMGIDFTPALILFTGFAFCSAYAQRTLSTRVRFLRRHTDDPYLAERFGEPVLVDNGDYGGGKAWLLAPDEKALAWLSAMMVMVALSALLWRIYD